MGNINHKKGTISCKLKLKTTPFFNSIIFIELKILISKAYDIHFNAKF